jgi:hypothetical protein
MAVAGTDAAADWAGRAEPVQSAVERCGRPATGQSSSGRGRLRRMAHIQDVVFDCQHPASLARFWVAALDGYEVAPYDDAEIERLRAAGINNSDDDPTVLVLSPSGCPRLWFQFVPEGKLAKNRVHLDLACDDASAEVQRLVALGATALSHQPNAAVIVMYDPEGNEYCLLR